MRAGERVGDEASPSGSPPKSLAEGLYCGIHLPRLKKLVVYSVSLLMISKGPPCAQGLLGSTPASAERERRATLQRKDRLAVGFSGSFGGERKLQHSLTDAR